MSNRDARKMRFTPESLEGRLAPSSMSPGSGPPAEVRHDGPGDNHPDRPDRDRGGDGDRGDNGSWEPKPIGHGSTRPMVPSGPVRWQGNHHDRHDHDHGDHDRGDNDHNDR
jgi:hypothetical protein